MLITATSHHFQQGRRRGASPLWWFVSLSLLLHGGLLAYRHHSILPVAGTPSSDMAVLLVERQTSKPIDQRPPTKHPGSTPAKPLLPKKPLTAQPGTEPEKVRESAIPVRNAASTGEAITKSVEHETGTESIDEAALQARLKVTLQQEIARHFSYPLLARKRGWQGEVLLAFRLEPDGSITGARVARSSGYGVLDRAALKALSKVKRITTDTHGGIAMQLPIIYRLES